ncbi:ModD protein [Caldichromatium japonicum]|uniref:Putative pyrophosphorylase ModD n=1 Tax=Caldichromatium japonicum TaxID=2699430 RepID=A0A6G7VFD6_9GAMM|nr:ModD protein [Caldichromatium japonicum]QIK38568.1 ModD protein [Caldichromatium japonicum]
MMRIADTALHALLDDDAGGGDLTTHALGIGAQPGRLSFAARQPMTVCCTEEAVRLFELAGARATLFAASGAQVGAGVPLLEADGAAASLHRAWKAAQVLVEWASGVSTAAAIVAAANGVPVACTRKNVPGTKALSIKAVRAGGATMHRLGLSETLLVFAEHRLFLDEAPAATVARLKRAEPEKKIVIEVANIDEARCWMEAGADVLQLEKFSPEQVAACRRASADFSRVLLAAAGGIHAGNAADYAAAGADLLVTSAPYTAPPRDVQVTFGSAS